MRSSSALRVTLEGNLGRDPYIGAGETTRVALFHLGCHQTLAGGPARETQWHPVAAFRNHVDAIERQVRKGTRLRIQGILQYNSRQKRDQVVVERFEVIARPKDTGQIRPALARSAAAEGSAHRAEPRAASPALQRSTPEKIRGHYRWQAYGPRRSLRKRIWIIERRQDENGVLRPVRG